MVDFNKDIIIFILVGNWIRVQTHLFECSWVLNNPILISLFRFPDGLNPSGR